MNEAWRGLYHSLHVMQLKTVHHTLSMTMTIMAWITLYKPWAVQQTVLYTTHFALHQVLVLDPYWTLCVFPTQKEVSTHMLMCGCLANAVGHRE